MMLYNIFIKVNKIFTKADWRCKNMKKILKIILSISLLNIILFLLLENTTAYTDKEKEIISYTVSQGETLWSIAKQYKDDKTDIRQYIYEIKQLNNMNTATIQAGQIIKLIKNERHNGNCNPSIKN